MSEQLKQLAEHSVSVFTATYTAKAQIPRFDRDEGSMYVSGRTPFDLVTMCKIVIAPASA